ncbi:MAG: phytoene/squalene synthase family protein [Planctomycetes bacterium]|nr:phytoene/squalene synthase family protein [Planctomycetota bacterium]
MSPSLDESYVWCRELAKARAGNFYYTFLTLPRSLRRDMCALYAFMRVSDDIGDADGAPVAQRGDELARWQRALRDALSGTGYEHAALPALADVVARRGIPPKYLDDVIEGVRMDLAPGEIETFADLQRYCYHVAGAVGLCCIHVWGFRDEAALAPAVDCGLAFQLTNILRDLREDAAMGRVYLPREDLERFGYAPADIAAGRRDERFRRLMAFEIERARGYYRSAARLVPMLAPSGRAILAAMLRVYGGLLDEIERRDYDVFSRRVSLPRHRKLWIAASSLVRYRCLRQRTIRL